MSEERAKWEALARKELGAAVDHPLVQRLLRAVDDDNLWYALEERGVVHAGTGQILTRQEITQSVLEILNKNLGGAHVH